MFEVFRIGGTTWLPGGCGAFCTAGGITGSLRLDVASISNKHSTIRGFNVVTAVWTNCCDYSVDVPAFSGGVLDSDIGASGQLR